ncbi:MAG: polyphosphate polymerase domain-containing protein [Planctomycetes bacterium]|nr:polyphosphate polymerase domain-containing protein [Planctomycetota bacterium]
MSATNNTESMRATRQDRRIELKFQVSHEQADRIRCWARAHLESDDHCDATLGDGYYINSLYLDTRNLDVFHRRKQVIARKHRLRRYGVEGQVWLETKRKSKDVVQKKRTCVNEEELHRLWQEPPTDVTPLCDGVAMERSWDGEWFRQRLRSADLRPVTIVRYERFARVGKCTTGPFRLTIDRHIRAQSASDWSIPRFAIEGEDLLPDAEILEFKFTDILPAQLRQLMFQESLQAAAFSKYRSAVSTCCRGLLTNE